MAQGGGQTLRGMAEEGFPKAEARGLPEPDTGRAAEIFEDVVWSQSEKMS